MWLFIATLVLITWYLYRFYSSLSNLPPGPLPLPIIGNLLSFVNVGRWEDKLVEWKQKYGDVFTIHIGLQRFVTVNSYKAAVKYFVKDGDSYTDRLENGVNDIMRGGSYGVIETGGQLWLEQRRFALKVLREFGLSKAQMEQRVLDEVEYIHNQIDTKLKKSDKFFNLEQYTDIAVGSIINAVVCGYRYTDGNEAEFNHIKKILNVASDRFSSMWGMFLMFNVNFFNLNIARPFIKYATEMTVKVLDNLLEQIEDHKKKNDYSNQSTEAKDFIDAYMIEKARLEANGEYNTNFSEKQLANVCFDLWVAGQETTSNSLTWAISYMVNHPETQQKAQEELDRVIGSNRLITMADRKDLHYVNAFVNEAQRCANLVLINILRRTNKEVEMDGKVLPKGTVVLPQISVIMHDPEVFDSPSTFNPDRFIDENGRFKQIDEVIPFSIGKRACLGEGLARMELFLIIANLLNRYRISVGDESPSSTRIGGMFSRIRPFSCRVELRHFVNVDRWEDKLVEWKQKYGDVFTIHIGLQRFVTVNSYKAAVKYFVKDGDSYTDKLRNEVNEMVRGGNYGVVETSGQLWLEQRRFALKVFREFGLSKGQMEQRILEEVEYIHNQVDSKIKNGDKNINIQPYTDIASGSVINAIVCGYRYTDGHEAEFYHLKNTLNTATDRFATVLSPFLMFNSNLFNVKIAQPILKYVREIMVTVLDIHLKQIEEHKKNNDYSNQSTEAKDFIDAYMIEKARLEANGEDNTSFTEIQLANVCFDLWIAGQETTSTTLTWAVSYILKYPETQQKAQEELDRVIGPNRLITMADRKDLHYVNAFVNEAQRCANVLLLNFPRTTTREVEVAGKVLPKGTIVVPQMSAIMNDPEVFDSPSTFNPDRFIDENGRFKQIDEVIPFSIGKRACLGEGLARMELFLIIANLLNRYRISVGDEPPSSTRIGGMFSRIKPFSCCVELRQ
ncbi:unnamed protein product [Bursaphelenchus okinawaensis]|uniref:CYtochrome P450 family n=1 Tax=Bursaphelenchus okinawaensis TaxID=465554 RepID=A0A811KXK1_9BILA|nr:unnamed protein product [Bursaphelenchus okinawaensis]CAG9115075.1 unnamed protein product [Bursaphelenchus okinawaensis]